MTKLLVLMGVLLAGPLAGRAQASWFRKYQPGSYVLLASPTVRHAANLRRNDDGTQLLVRTDDGDKRTLKAEEVRGCMAGGRRYVTAVNFEAGGRQFATRVLVELVDSGRVELLRYEYKATTTSSGELGSSAVSTTRLQADYLLHHPGSAGYLPVASSGPSASGPQFLNTVRPYIASRPELLALVETGRLTADDLPSLIHAVNSGEPYRTLPAAHEAGQ